MARTLRDVVVLAALAAAAVGYDRRDRNHAAGDASERHVILVVSDGLRWQEVFRGADSLLVAGHAAARQTYWRPTLDERRRALMPFVWSRLAAKGVLFGNRDAGSRVSVTNGLNFSYPGYNELLVGYADPRIDRNDYGPNPNVTVFEWLNRREEFRERVAAAGAWDAFADIFNRRRSGLPMHASRREPLDRMTHEAALYFLRTRRPRALFVAYVETDDHAHSGRYDRTLDAAHAVDSYLAALWDAVQSDPRYRGRTTLIFTADHGRGRTAADWTSHGQDVAGADEVFVAMLGPNVGAHGEWRGVTALAQSQVAATVAAALGLDYRRDVPRAAAAVIGATVPAR